MLTAISGVKTGYFGAVGLFAVIYYASGIPRVQKDILQVREVTRSVQSWCRHSAHLFLQKLPFIGGHFVHEIPASDNVRFASPSLTDTTDMLDSPSKLCWFPPLVVFGLEIEGLERLGPTNTQPMCTYCIKGDVSYRPVANRTVQAL